MTETPRQQRSFARALRVRKMLPVELYLNGRRVPEISDEGEAHALVYQLGLRATRKLVRPKEVGAYIEVEARYC